MRETEAGMEEGVSQRTKEQKAKSDEDKEMTENRTGIDRARRRKTKADTENKQGV
jgi:hypothetical protein